MEFKYIMRRETKCLYLFIDGVVLILYIYMDRNILVDKNAITHLNIIFLVRNI